jgi:hypothetical protein
MMIHPDPPSQGYGVHTSQKNPEFISLSPYKGGTTRTKPAFVGLRLYSPTLQGKGDLCVHGSLKKGGSKVMCTACYMTFTQKSAVLTLPFRLNCSQSL